MKSTVRYLVPLVGFAVALPAMLAQTPAAPAEQHKELRIITGPGDGMPPPHRGHHMMGGPREMESVTFLGIATEPANPVLTDQLGLAKGTGLVVTMVSPGSPATDVLKPHDVVVKVDDQLLIEQRQLAVLIRNHKEGDEVTLTFIRGGKEATAKVKLAKHDVPKMAMGDGQGMDLLNMHRMMMGGQGGPGMGREDMDRVLSLIDHGGPGGPGMPGPGGEQVIINRQEGPGMHSVTVSTNNSNMVFSDEDGSLDLTIKDGKKTLVAKNAKGEQLYSGPVDTPEQRKALPADVRTRLDKLEGMQEYSFKTDGDFTPGEVKDARQQRHGIVLPVPPADPAPRPAPTF
jgi:hypothetical protein